MSPAQSLHLPSGLAASFRANGSRLPAAAQPAQEGEALLTLPITRSSTTASPATSPDDDDFDDADDDDDNFLHPTFRSVRLHSRRKRWFRSPRSMFFLLLALLMAATLTYVWARERSFRVRWKLDPETVEFVQRPLLAPLDHTCISSYELPLRTKGRYIVDGRGRRFKLLSINWYGASDELFVPGGLDIQNRTTIAQTVKRLGFNSVRLPYADEMVTTNPKIHERLVSANPDLIGLRALDVFEAVTRALTEAGIAVIINNHITSATWCCGADPCDAAWANDHLGPLCRVRQTEEQWIENWETVMSRFVDEPLVIGADLRNEVRGLWGTMPWEKWAAAAERCGNRLLKMKSDWLVVVEGTESANDLSGAARRPILLDVAHRLVYSAHVYKWSGWGSMDGRFLQRSYASFARTMRHNWAYLLEQDVAPVWVGEIGVSCRPTVGDARYWGNLWRFLKHMDADFGYWALNPRKPHENANETYSLVQDDWVTPVVDYRMKDMSEAMRNWGRR